MNANELLYSIDLSDISTNILPNKKENIFLSVSVCESITSGLFSNKINQKKYSNYYYGGIIFNNIFLNSIDIYTAFYMAKRVSNIFNTRIGISNLGYILYNKDDNYYYITMHQFYICLYDKIRDFNKIFYIDNEITKKYNITEINNIKLKIIKKIISIYKKYCYDNKI